MNITFDLLVDNEPHIFGLVDEYHKNCFDDHKNIDFVLFFSFFNDSKKKLFTDVLVKNMVGLLVFSTMFVDKFFFFKFRHDIII